LRRPGWRRIALAALVAVTALSLLLLVLQAAALADAPDESAAPVLTVLLLHSHAGLAWWLGIAALAAAGFCARWRTASGLLVALAAFLYTRAMVSHAAGDGDLDWAMAAHWLHLCGACAWAGVVLVGATAPWQGDNVQAAARRLSRVATAALALVLVSALLRLALLPNFAVAGFTPNVQALAGKLVLVAGVIALGAFNRFAGMPALGEPAGVRRFVRVLRIEALLMGAVLLAAAVLASTPPG